jgi:hypothetical protein
MASPNKPVSEFAIKRDLCHLLARHVASVSKAAVRHWTMTVYPDENPLKRRIIEKGFLEDKKQFAQDVSVHFVELCDACRRGDLEAVQT